MEGNTYQVGVSDVMIYPMIYPDKTGYKAGFRWPGVISIETGSDGGEATDLWGEDYKYGTIRDVEVVRGSITAFSRPPKFYELDGFVAAKPGVYIGQQERFAFGICFKTGIGNAYDVNGDDAYYLHILYNVSVSPCEVTHTTLTEDVEATEYSWEFLSTPRTVSGYVPACEIVIDSSVVDEQSLLELEQKLYGSTGKTGFLPSPVEVVETVLPKDAFSIITDVINQNSSSIKHSVSISLTNKDRQTTEADFKWMTLRSTEALGGVIEAYTRLEAFNECDGIAVTKTGIQVGQQTRKKFGFCYRTEFANGGYMLHLVYNASVSPPEIAYETLSDGNEIPKFSWEYTTVPVESSDYMPTSEIIIDSRGVYPEELERLEGFLYGGFEYPFLPSPDDVINTFSEGSDKYESVDFWGTVECGISRMVIYPIGESGSKWQGIISVSESSEGAEPADLWLQDGTVTGYRNFPSTNEGIMNLGNIPTNVISGSQEKISENTIITDDGRLTIDHSFVLDVAVRQIDASVGPDQLWLIGAHYGNLAVGYQEIRKNKGKYEPELTNWIIDSEIEKALDGAIEFDGNWVYDEETGLSTLETQWRPWIFWIDYGNVLYGQQGFNEASRVVLDTQATSVKVCKGYSSAIYLEQDQGLIVAYIKNKVGYYRQYVYNTELGAKRWDEAVQLDIDEDVLYLNVHRLNDYRVAFEITTPTKNLWVYTTRTYVGQSFKMESETVHHRRNLAFLYCPEDTDTSVIFTPSISDDHLLIQINVNRELVMFDDEMIDTIVPDTNSIPRGYIQSVYFINGVGSSTIYIALGAAPFKTITNIAINPNEHNELQCLIENYGRILCPKETIVLDTTNYIRYEYIESFMALRIVENGFVYSELIDLYYAMKQEETAIAPHGNVEFDYNELNDIEQDANIETTSIGYVGVELSYQQVGTDPI